jgi:ATP-dependent helicase/nuclease subunit A
MKRVENKEFLELISDSRPAQQEAIMADEDLVVVSAGAGTGKTETLARRYAWLVTTGRAKFNQILTLTFTEKAALEMRERIRMRLRNWYKQLSNQGNFQHLYEAIDNLDEAPISTIHSFCMRIIQKASLYFDIDPNIRVISSPEEFGFWNNLQNILRRNDWNWFDENVSDPVWQSRLSILNQEPFFLLLNHGGADDFVQLVNSLSDLFGSRGENPEWLWQKGERVERDWEEIQESLLSWYATQWDEEWSLWIELILPLMDLRGSSKVIGTFIDFNLKWHNRPDKRQLPFFMSDLIDSLTAIAKSSRNAVYLEIQDQLLLSRPFQSMIEYRNQLKEKYLHLIDILCGKVELSEDFRCRQFLIQSSAIFWQVWEEFKKKKSLLTFNDMIAYAGEAIKQYPTLTSQYSSIMVDEFQDTDLLQESLIRNIVQNNQASLFVVGDLKQSIYRFRHADLSIFHQYIQEAQYNSKSGRHIVLGESFRSRDDLVSEMNSLFGFIWKDGLSQKIPHEYDPLQVPNELSWWEERSKSVSASHLRFLFLGNTDQTTKETERRCLLARCLADEVNNLVGKAIVWDKAEKKARLCQYRDIVILVPTRTFYKPLEQVLQDELNIPVIFVTDVNYFSRGETLDAVAYLKTVVDPQDDLALANYLSSPFSGLSLAEVHDLLVNADRSLKNGWLWKTLQEKYPNICEKLIDLNQKMKLTGPASILSELLKESSHLKATPRSLRRRVAVNLRRSIDLAREYENSIGNSGLGCARYLQDAILKEVKSEEANPVGEEEDVVRVMTIHSAKGLEFPVVALFGLEYTPHRRPRNKFQSSRELGAITRYFPDYWEMNGQPLMESDVDFPSYFIEQQLQEAEEISEQQRLFYVACTRAQDTLILSGVCPISNGEIVIKPKTWLSWVWDWIEKDRNEDPRQYLINLFPDGQDSLFISTSKANEEIEDGGMDLPRQPLPRLQRLTATAYAFYRFCPHAYRMRYRQGISLPWELPSDDEKGGADLGNMVHWILAQWDFNEQNLDRWLPLHQDRFLEIKTQLPIELRPFWNTNQDWEKVRIWLTNLSQSHLGLSLQKNYNDQKLEREKPFEIKLNGGLVLAGIRDLLWKDNEGVHIIDYKTSSPDTTVYPLYQEQMHFYGLAARLQYPEHPVQIALYYIKENLLQIIKNLPSEDEMISRVYLVARKAASQGDFQPGTDNCPSCPWKRDCSLYLGNQ